MQTAKDVCEIKPKGRDSLWVSLILVGHNVHICEFEGEAKRVGDHYEYVETDSSAESPCHLVIRVDAKGVRFSTLGDDQCTEYCGANMSLSMGAFYPRSRSWEG